MNIDFNDPQILEKIIGVDYARAFHFTVAISRLCLGDFIILANDKIHEFADKYSPSRK
jgi:hypothetical protein